MAIDYVPWRQIMFYGPITCSMAYRTCPMARKLSRKAGGGDGEGALGHGAMTFIKQM